MKSNERLYSRVGARTSAHPPRRILILIGLTFVTAALILLTGCGPVRLVASANIPQPLVMKIPVAVALLMPQEFTQYIHKEERWGTDWNIEIGKAQSDAMARLLNAMFERVIVVDSLNAGTQLGEGVAAILEPSVEEYAFVTPRDAGSPFFAVSIKYRVNVYLPDGKLADSWGFTGYGNAPAGGLSNTQPLQNATASAMRDAGAKLAVEFRDQAIVRGLLPEAETADGPGAVPAATTEEESAAPTQPAPEVSPVPPLEAQQPEEEGAEEEPAQAPGGDPSPTVEPSPAMEEEAKEPEEPAEAPDVGAFAKRLPPELMAGS